MITVTNSFDVSNEERLPDLMDSTFLNVPRIKPVFGKVGVLSSETHFYLKWHFGFCETRPNKSKMIVKHVIHMKEK